MKRGQRRGATAARPAAGARVLLAVEVRHPLAERSARVLRAAARAFTRALGLDGRELSLSLVSDRTIRALNRDWRGKDRATDVLSFPQESAERAKGARAPVPAQPLQPIGDVVISLQTALRQAAQGGWPLSRELRRLLAHGLLHCLGHDHETHAQAQRMARAELQLLGRAGLVGEALSQR